MLRRTMIALCAAASVAMLVPETASARGGFHGGGGFRGGGGFHGGGFRAGGIGIGGGGFRAAAIGALLGFAALVLFAGILTFLIGVCLCGQAPHYNKVAFCTALVIVGGTR